MVSVLILSVISAVYGESLIRAFQGQSKTFSGEVIQNFNKAADYSQSEIVAIYAKQAEAKGQQLISKDKLSLTTTFVENQILFIKDYIIQSQSVDPDIVFAGFYSMEGEDIQPIQISTPKHPKGVGDGVSYDEDEQRWKLTKGDQSIYDPNLMDLLAEKKPVVRKLEEYQFESPNGETRTIQAYDVMTPILEGSIDEIDERLEEEEPVGFLRYIISLEALNTTIKRTKGEMDAILAQQLDSAKQSEETMAKLSRKSRRNLFIVLLGSAVGLFLFGTVTAKFSAKRFSTPILALSKMASAIAKGNYSENKDIDKERKDELGTLAVGFDQMRVQIKTFTENLQELIDEKTEDIMSILQNIEQGIFTIDKESNIRPEYSTYLESIFNRKDLAGIEFEELLFKNADLDSEQLSCSRSTVLTSLGNTKIAFKLNRKHLPKEYSIAVDDEKRFLELDWCPILKQKKIEKIMVTVRDVTKLKELEAASQEKARDLEMIDQLVHLEGSKFKQVYQNTISLLNECIDALKSDPVGKEDIVFRNIHTAKGLLRTYGLKLISSALHDIEEDFPHKSEAVTEQMERDRAPDFISRLEHAIEIMESYRYINDDKLGRANQASAVTQESLEKIRSRIASFLDDSGASDKLFQEIHMLLDQDANHNLGSLLEDLVAQVGQDAEKLGKEIPAFSANGDAVLISPDNWQKLSGIFTHVIRNSLDHGLEPASERTAAGKEEYGTISLKSTIDPKNIKLLFKDDGRGLNLPKLRELGSFADDASNEEVANFIFRPSVSTASEVTDISGRGVGMDAVKAEIEKMGGSIEIKLGKPSDSGFAPFEFEIRLPLELRAAEGSSQALGAAS